MPRNLHECPKCEYATSVAYRLARHVQGVHKIRESNCDQCDFSATWQRVLQGHINRVHLHIPDLMCDQCGYKASQSSDLIRHHKIVHQKIKDVECDQCGYKTSVRHQLVAHVNTVHLKIREMKCPLCQYQTADKHNLQQHQKGCPIRDMKCPQCEYWSSSKDIISQHRRAVHDKAKDLKCNDCDFVTAWPSNMRKHRKKRHQEGGKKIKKELQLPVQEKIQTLNMSENGHNKVRNFKCQFCIFSTKLEKKFSLTFKPSPLYFRPVTSKVKKLDTMLPNNIIP